MMTYRHVFQITVMGFHF